MSTKISSKLYRITNVNPLKRNLKLIFLYRISNCGKSATSLNLKRIERFSVTTFFFIIKSWCVKLFNSKTDWIHHTTPPLVYQTAAGALKALGIFALPQKLNIYNPNNGGFGVIKETREGWERHTFPRFSADVYTAALKSPAIDPR